MTKGKKAIAKKGVHSFEVGTELEFLGIDYDPYDLECYVFMDSNGKIDDLVESEFEWK